MSAKKSTPFVEQHYTSLIASAHTSLVRDPDPKGYYFGETPLVQPEIYEPQPRLDYAIIYRNLRSLVPCIRDRAVREKYFQAYEDLAEARANHKKCYRRYQVAYNKLQDLIAYRKIMIERKARVQKVIKEWHEQEGMEVAVKEKEIELETIVSQIDKNGKAGPPLLEELDRLASMKDAVSSVFASMKSNLVKNHLPRLAVFKKQVNDRARLHRAQATCRANANSDTVQRRQALSIYHQAVYSEILKRKGPSPQLAKAVEQQFRIVADRASTAPNGREEKLTAASSKESDRAGQDESLVALSDSPQALAIRA